MMNPKYSSLARNGVMVLGLALLAVSPAWGYQYHWNPSMAEQTVQTPFMFKVVNEDQFKGNWKQLKGALKENWGEFTDDDLMIIEGKKDKFEGKLQERYGDRKEEVKEWVDKWLDQQSSKSSSATRERKHP
jgi:uncharacterized protein YjbJ (UPF0337 family)